MMEKMKMHSPNLTQENIARIRELFPSCVTEVQGEDGNLRLAVDFDQLRQELSESIVEGPQERYHLNWPGKREALLTANAPIAKTLRPCREDSVDFDTTKNLFIEGDNLDALKLLQETYLGKVKMIYIDPPYNTGKDFIYEDDFAENAEEFLKRSNQKDEKGNRLVANTEANGRFHSNWLSMMYPRLKLARTLLRDDGCILISIDENELPNLWKTCGEIFGSENFVECLVYDKKAAPKGVPPVNMIVGVHEYILCFQKTDKFSFIGVPRSMDGFSNPDNDPRGPWRNTNCKSTVKDSSETFEITDPETGFTFKDTWAHKKTEMERMAAEGILIFPSDASGQVRKKEYFNEFKNANIPIKSSLGLYDAQANTQAIVKLMGDKVFQNPKNIKLMKDLVSFTTTMGDIIMDFFVGSGTTAQAVLEVNAELGGNRRFIVAQIDEECGPDSDAYKAGFRTIANISKERIRRAGKMILEGECHEGWNKDIGFRVLKIDSSNMADVYYTPDAIEQGQLKIFTDNIKSDRKPEDLLFQVLLDWGVDLSLPIRKETIQGKTVFFVNEPPYDLVACFDTGVNEDLVKELARFEPLRVVFRDTGFVSDAVKINVEQIFKQMSPGTEVKSI